MFSCSVCRYDNRWSCRPLVIISECYIMYKCYFSYDQPRRTTCHRVLNLRFNHINWQKLFQQYSEVLNSSLPFTVPHQRRHYCCVTWTFIACVALKYDQVWTSSLHRHNFCSNLIKSTFEKRAVGCQIFQLYFFIQIHAMLKRLSHSSFSYKHVQYIQWGMRMFLSRSVSFDTDICSRWGHLAYLLSTLIPQSPRLHWHWLSYCPSGNKVTLKDMGNISHQPTKINQWLSARLQYLQCVSGDTEVLHQAIGTTIKPEQRACTAT